MEKRTEASCVFLLLLLFACLFVCDPLINERQENAVHPGMKKIPSAGKTFQQGWNDTLASPDERPGMQSSFTYDYWIDTTEVTQKHFQGLMGRDPVPDSLPYGVGDNFPVYEVSWFDAVLFCNARSKAEKLDTVYHYSGMKSSPKTGSVYDLTGLSYDFSVDGYRLPTEAEWEFAARGGASTLLFSNFSDTAYAENFAWYTANSSGRSHPVAGKLPNGFGLYDLAGNVWEWTNDWKGFYNGAPVTNSLGALQPDNGYEKVIKGGAYRYGYVYLKPSQRSATYATTWSSANEYVGFRCARGAVSNGRYLGAGQQSFVPDPVNILINGGDLRSFIGTSRSKVVFVNVTGAHRTLCCVDFSRSFPVVREYTDDSDIYMPAVSPDGRLVAYCSRNMGLSGPSKVTVRSLDSLNSPLVRLGADPAYIPRWWVDPATGDTCVIYTNSAIINSSDGWTATKTFVQKISNGRPSGTARVVIDDGGFHDGISINGSYAVTGYDRLIMRNLATSEQKQLFKYPHNGKNATGSAQVCNVTLSPDTGADVRCLFLDFGSPGKSTITGGSYGIHQFMFVSSFADSVTNAIRCPADEDSWNYCEWSNRSRFAVSCCENSGGRSHAIYAVNLDDHRSVPMMTGVELQQPNLWIGEIDSNPGGFALDSLGFYNDPPVDYSQGLFASKMNLFWTFHDSVQVVFVGNSLVQAGIDCRVLKKYQSVNMGFPGCGLQGYSTIINDYLLPHAPKLKVIGIYIPFYYFGLPLGESTPTWWNDVVCQSKGFIYDRDHHFWKDSLPGGLDAMIVKVPCPPQEGDSLGDIVTWGCTGWGGPNPDAPVFTPWTVDDSIYKQNFAAFVDLIKAVSLKNVHLVAIHFPESPYYKNTDHYLRYGPSWETGRAVLAQIKAIENDYPYFHVYDAYQDGNHDYTDDDAHDYNHMCWNGSAKLTKRLDSIFTIILK